jgi:uncharacterized protein
VSATSQILARLSRLPPARTHDVAVERDLDAKMSDGSVLLADRWYPERALPAELPVVLLRSPYGRRRLGILGRLFAERGYQTVIQSCRGTFGSGGVWEPFHHEVADGRDTLAWIQRQPWCGPGVATFGPSYLGLTQWSLLDDPQPAQLAAIAPSVTATRFRDAVIYPGGSFALETALTWINQVEHQELKPPRVIATMLTTRRAIRRGAGAPRLADADRLTVGRHVAYYQDWLAHAEGGDTWWDPLDFGRRLDHCPPASMVGGWYDIFLPGEVADFEALQSRGIAARLVIGPWTHASPGAMGASLREAFPWFDAHVAGGPPAPTGVRLFVMGEGRWVDLPAWPPPATRQPWYLHAGGRLDPTPPIDSPPDRYRYDPAAPTPSLGGPSLEGSSAGRKDQKGRESRADVVTYTSEQLAMPMTVAGPLTVRLHVRATLPHTDVYVRLCDVTPKGRSENLSDGILRLRPGAIEPDADGALAVTVEMWPTANTFRAGHRIRLQVSAGAHPLFARNPGTGEPLGTAQSMRVVDHEILHDPAHPSAVMLPVSPI